MGSFSCYNCSKIIIEDDNKINCNDNPDFDWKKIRDQWMKCPQWDLK